MESREEEGALHFRKREREEITKEQCEQNFKHSEKGINFNSLS